MVVDVQVAPSRAGLDIGDRGGATPSMITKSVRPPCNFVARLATAERLFSVLELAMIVVFALTLTRWERAAVLFSIQ